eukprot:PhF_6_TR10379/c0_g1_i1/m.16167
MATGMVGTLHVFVVIHIICIIRGGVRYERQWSSSSSYSLDNGRVIAPLSVRSWNWFIVPAGQWRPKLLLAMGGPFFSTYTDHVKPHVWVWVTMSIGTVMTIVATLLELASSSSYESTCNVSAVLCGGVLIASGCIHILKMRVVTRVRGVSVIRGVRMIVMGSTMAIMAGRRIQGSFSKTYENDENGMLSVVTFFSSVETGYLLLIRGWAVTQKHKREPSEVKQTFRMEKDSVPTITNEPES